VAGMITSIGKSNDSTVLVVMTGYMDCIVMEAIEIKLYPRNFEKNTRCPLSHS
jgi:hypothetical protein